MPIVRLDISDFRNICSAKAEPHPDGFNLIYGNNGSGKTSLLEAIYYLSLGRSFRSTNNSHIVRNSANRFAIYSHVMTQNNQNIAVGVERLLSGDFKARIAGDDVSSISEIAGLLPVQLINSNCYNLIDSGPHFRRKYLDWGAFYQSTDFLRVWRNYRRILKQRNAALSRHLSKKELNAWDDELEQCALLLHQLRSEYVAQLLPLLKAMVGELLSISELKISYFPGWDESLSYKETLAQHLGKDLHLGYTQLGPHRANFNVIINGLPAKDILSRGQQKLFVCAMILAQGALLYRSQNKRPIYLVDDLPSELDMTSRSNLVALLSKQEAQVFVTTVEQTVFDSCFITKPVKMFHVEHGNLTQV